MEFRHPSWSEARPILREQGVAWCFAETDDTPEEAERVLSSPFAYLRLRKDEYDEEQLKPWAERIGDARASLNHQEKGDKQQQAIDQFIALPAHKKESVFYPYYTAEFMRERLQKATKQAIVQQFVEPHWPKLSSSQRESIHALLEQLT
jgi:uncharacterized protein YecE (DUF72 family)